MRSIPRGSEYFNRTNDIAAALTKDKELYQIYCHDFHTSDQWMDIRCEETIFEQCHMSVSNFKRGKFTDVLFRNSDISNAKFHQNYFANCCFEGVRCTGTIFSGSIFRYVQFTNCILEYSNMSSVQFTDVNFSGCMLDNAILSQCKHKNMLFHECSLRGTSFFHTSLKKVDLTSCELEDLALSDEAHELRGAIVNISQATELARHLGLEIKL